MDRDEDEESTSSEEDDENVPSPTPVEKRVRIIDPKEVSGAEEAAIPALLAKTSIQPSTSTFQEVRDSGLSSQIPPRTGSFVERRQDTAIPGTSHMDPLIDDSSSLSSEDEESIDEVVIPVYVEKKVRIVEPKEVQEELEREAEFKQSEEERKITFCLDVKDEEEDPSKNDDFRDKSGTIVAEEDSSRTDTKGGKHSIYSRYMDQNASMMRDSRRSFVFDHNPTDMNAVSSMDIDGQERNEFQVEDFTHGFQKNRQYIIPQMTEHEIHRLSCSRFLDDSRTNVSEVSVRDHISLGLAYLTVNNKQDLKEIFIFVGQNMQSYGKVYSARMLGRYHEYSRLFQYRGGNEGGIVASMRFTSHCSDIIKSYIQLAALIEDAEGFTKVIMELAKRHAKLGLTLRDHQVHYRRFVEIFGSTHDERIQLQSKIYLFVCLVSRSILLAEQKIRYSNSEDESSSSMAARSVIKITKPKQEMSRKQPIWD